MYFCGGLNRMGRTQRDAIVCAMCESSPFRLKIIIKLTFYNTYLHLFFRRWRIVHLGTDKKQKPIVRVRMQSRMVYFEFSLLIIAFLCISFLSKSKGIKYKYVYKLEKKK